MSVNINLSDFERTQDGDILGFSLEDIAQNLSKSPNLLNGKVILIEMYHCMDADPLSNSIKVMTKEKLFEEIKSQFDDYEQIQMTYFDEYCMFEFYQGYRNGIAVFRVYNLKKKDFDSFYNKNKDVSKLEYIDDE